MKVSGKGRSPQHLEMDGKENVLKPIRNSTSIDSSDGEVSFSHPEPEKKPDPSIWENPDLPLIGQILRDLNSHPVVVLGHDKLPDEEARKYLT